MKKNTYNTDGLSAEDRALNTFAELMIEKICNLQEDWKKPWFSPQVAQLPKNLNGRNYNGMNSIVLMLMQEKNGWQTSRYATFDRIVSLNFTKDKDGKKAAVDENGNKLPRVGINKGEKSTPVMLTTFTCEQKSTSSTTIISSSLKTRGITTMSTQSYRFITSSISTRPISKKHVQRCIKSSRMKPLGRVCAPQKVWLISLLWMP